MEISFLIIQLEWCICCSHACIQHMNGNKLPSYFQFAFSLLMIY